MNKSPPHGFLCTLVRLAKRQVFLYHVSQHEQHVPFRMMTFMAKQGVRLGSCELFIDHGFLDQFRNCHLFWQQFLCEATPEFIARLCIVCNPKKAVGSCRGRLPGRFQLLSAHALPPRQLISHLLPLR